MYDNAFMVSPPAQRLTGRPGETVEGTVYVGVYSYSASPLDYQAHVIPYSVDTETYMDDFSSHTDRTIATNWVTIDEPTGTVEPNGSLEIHFRVAIPEDASGGGQYFAIAVGSVVGSDVTSGIGIHDVAEIASVVYLEIAGDVVREGEVLANSIPFISFTTPVTTSAAFSNTGNTHMDAVIRTTAVDVFSGYEVYPEGDQKYTSTLVMPGSRKSYDTHITGLSDVGLYRITQAVTYGGSTTTASRLTLVCPIWIVLLVAGVITAAIALLIMRIFSRRRTI